MNDIPPPSTLLRDFEQEIQVRLAELQPAVDEHADLVAVCKRMGWPVGSAAAGAGTPRSAPSKRQAAILALVTERPGVTIAEMAETFGIGTSALYGPTRVLCDQRLLVKRGRGFHPAD